MVSGMNRQVSFPTVTTWSFVSLPSAALAEGLAELDVEEGEIEIEEGGMEIEEYVSSEEELAPETCATNWTRVRKVVKALGVI
jgi:hypothetical protein